MAKMNPEVKAKWLAALRSGEYEQGQYRLKREFEDGESRYCCLGVLCDLYLKETGGKWHPAPITADLYGIAFSIDEETQFLPPAVIKWAGLVSMEQLLIDGTSLTHLNDSENVSFEGIAALIEENL